MQYSFAFRYCYRHIDEINKTTSLSYLKERFNLNDIELRSLLAEVQTKISQIKTQKEKLEEEIIEISDDIKELNKKDILSKKERRKLFKLNKKLDYKNSRLSKDITFGGLNNLRRLSFLHNNKELNKDKISEVKKIYNENRLLPFYILGEANQKGNRFFSFDFNNKTIIYKPNKNTKIEIKYNNYSNYRGVLSKLQELINDKEISVSIRLSTEYIYLIFDNEKLNGYAIDESSRRLDVKQIKENHICKDTQKELIKEVYKEYYRKLEDKKLSNKLSYRYLAFDTNPDYIGCSILDKISETEFKIVKTFSYDLTELNKMLSKETTKEERILINNKRKHGIYHIWKDIFETAMYYKVGSIIQEDLDIKNKDLGNKIANRKVNNLWYRTISDNTINKYIQTLGFIDIKINPCYTSFIGNIMYDYVDPVNASIEIGRRGINKYIRGSSFYPEFNTNTIIDTMSKLNDLIDVQYIQYCKNWVEAYREVHQSGLRYRATLEDIDIGYNVVNNINHSNIKKQLFSSEIVMSLLKKL